MNDRIMLKVSAGEQCICFRTVSRSRKSPKRFYVTRDEFTKLETQASVISHDGWSFAVLQRDTQADTLMIQFTWLSGSSHALIGWDETVTVPYPRLPALKHISSLEKPSLCSETRKIKGVSHFATHPK